MKKKNLMETKYRLIRLILIVFSVGALFLGSSLLLFAPLRDFIIITVEKTITHRTLNHEIWQNRLAFYAVPLFILSVIMFGICLGKTLEKIADAMRKVFLEVKNLTIPNSVALLAFLCLFLFLYVRFNINIMPIIVCWIIYRLGFLNWLAKTFGKKETKMALILSVIAIVFFIAVMLMFKIAIVMDVFYGDSNRVFGDFTEVSANHYRVKVHPFYVLIWQSLYHLFCPLVNKTSLAIRVMVAIFAGLNIGIFSLFVSRLTKSKVLNVVSCAVMIFSFPQIYHGAQMLESFIFTQTSILLMLLYFSFAFFKKEEYNTPVLLALSLFVAGNNIAYICVFGIFYIILLCRISESWVAAWNKIWVFSIWFLVMFSALLLAQTLFYGISAPSNIFSMFMGIVSEEGSYIAAHPVSWVQYAKNFFGIILFAYLPFDIGSLFNHGWVWAFLLLAPVIGFKKITHKPLFVAVAVSCLFLFVFHRFYGITELSLYSPVIMCVYLSMFAFIAQILPEKIATSICGLLLAVMVLVNSIGTYTVHRMNQYVFGSLDIGDFREYETNIDELKGRIAGYKRNPLLFFKVLKEAEKWPSSPLYDEILRAYQNNDIDIFTLPPAEANRAPRKFFFGLENRRKLIFEHNTLKDFKTGETLFSFSGSKTVIRPWDYTVEITGGYDETMNIITETANGIFVDGKLVEGTGEIISIPDFTEYKYPIVMKILYHEIMFSIIDGVPYARLFDYFHNEQGKPEPIVWYRDIAYVGLFLEAIERTDLIADFVAGINEMYDANRFVKEPDNLGQILYLQSLVKNQNHKLIQDIIDEAKRICDDKGNLCGTTDGARSSAYQNGWLIYGLKRLGMENEAVQFNSKSTIDDNGYSHLLWFMLPDNTLKIHREQREVSDYFTDKHSIYTNVHGQPYPYIDIGMEHFAMRSGNAYRNPILTQITYPITWGDGTRPHIWHDAELFLYLMELRVSGLK